MKKIFLLSGLLIFSLAAQAEEDMYFVEDSVNNENFIINGIQFAAKSICPGFEVGDQVFFLDGQPDGSSTEALIVDQRTNVACDVWCQYPY